MTENLQFSISSAFSNPASSVQLTVNLCKVVQTAKSHLTLKCFPKLSAEIFKKSGSTASLVLCMPVSVLRYFFDDHFFKIAPNRGRVGGLPFDDGWEPSKQNVNW